MRLAVLAAVVLVAAAAVADTWFWVDAGGVTHFTDDPESLPEGAAADRGELRQLWQDPLGARLVDTATGSREGDRSLRLIRGAVEDLERGETARATAALRSVLRLEPARPEAHWYLALLDRQRGRYESAEGHLRAFLAAAGEDLSPWRASAERRLESLVDERRLADSDAPSPSGWVDLASDDFRVSYHAALGEASPDYARIVLGYLEEARRSVGELLGAMPTEPMGVVFYGKAAYLEAHQHRFSFQTVGFFDGRIHVVSAAHPRGELRALLFHEYTHAVFREQTSGDRPYWLNEGLAELSERSSRSQRRLTRSERVLLRSQIDRGRWIPLRRIAPSFAGLGDEGARTAYLEATAAAALIEDRTDRAGRARLLAALGRGVGDDEALRAALGLDTDGVDAAVQAWILEEFKSLPAGLQEADPRVGF